MSDVQQLMRERYPDNTWADVAGRDGKLPPVLAEQCNPAQDLADIPFERYIDQDFFEREFDLVWKRVWQFACRDEHLAEPGDFFVYDVGRLSAVSSRRKPDSRHFTTRACTAEQS